MKKEEKTNKKIIKEGGETRDTEYWQYPVNYIKVNNYSHQGKCIDFAHNVLDMPVYACFSGTIIYSQWQSTGGNVVYIQHANGIKASYGHLKTSLVKKGDKVTQGQQIGIMGDTGSAASGVHLHFGLYSANLSDYLHNSDLDSFNYLYVHTNYQTVAVTTLNNYGSKLKYYPEGSGPNTDSSNLGKKYVYNVDDEGLVVRKTAGGASTGKFLETATEVNVLETSGSWSRIGTNEWVYSSYLSNTCPKYYVVSGADSEGLNVRNQASTSGTILNTLKNGRRVQIYSTSGTWAKVSNDESRWCSKNYLVLGN